MGVIIICKLPSDQTSQMIKPLILSCAEEKGGGVKNPPPPLHTIHNIPRNKLNFLQSDKNEYGREGAEMVKIASIS